MSLPGTYHGCEDDEEEEDEEEAEEQEGHDGDEAVSRQICNMRFIESYGTYLIGYTTISQGWYIVLRAP